MLSRWVISRQQLPKERGVSPIISTILLVAIVVILAAVISVFVIGMGENLQSPGPSIAESSGEFVAGSGADDQVVRITHVAGDTVDIHSVEIILRETTQNEEVRLVDLPGDGYYKYTLDDSNIVGDSDVIDQGNQAYTVNEGPVYAEASDHQWEAGETIAIEIGVSGWDFRTSDYNNLEVLIVHTESDSILVEKQFST